MEGKRMKNRNLWEENAVDEGPGFEGGGLKGKRD